MADAALRIFLLTLGLAWRRGQELIGGSAVRREGRRDLTMPFGWSTRTAFTTPLSQTAVLRCCSSKAIRSSSMASQAEASKYLVVWLTGNLRGQGETMGVGRSQTGIKRAGSTCADDRRTSKTSSSKLRTGLRLKRRYRSWLAEPNLSQSGGAKFTASAQL